METRGFAISFATCQPENRSRDLYSFIHSLLRLAAVTAIPRPDHSTLMPISMSRSMSIYTTYHRTVPPIPPGVLSPTSSCHVRLGLLPRSKTPVIFRTSVLDRTDLPATTRGGSAGVWSSSLMTRPNSDRCPLAYNFGDLVTWVFYLVTSTMSHIINVIGPTY